MNHALRIPGDKLRPWDALVRRVLEDPHRAGLATDPGVFDGIWHIGPPGPTRDEGAA
ncbi:MAG: hypothetical protein JKY37_10955 [Nannocystaceae bacterium]|nr:hypothetical protein [Nannocystaceae bacterium]